MWLGCGLLDFVSLVVFVVCLRCVCFWVRLLVWVGEACCISGFGWSLVFSVSGLLIVLLRFIMFGYCGFNLLLAGVTIVVVLVCWLLLLGVLWVFSVLGCLTLYGVACDDLGVLRVCIAICFFVESGFGLDWCLVVVSG